MSRDSEERVDVEVDVDVDMDGDAAQASASEESDGVPEEPTDLMVVSRARRSNAGNRMSTLLAKTAQEDEWGEEWEEAQNEEEFVGDDGNEHEDFNLDSSSSEDDDEGGDDDAGEQELRKAERQERTKKRKVANNPFAARLAAAAARKRVKLAVPPSDSHSASAPRPKKKSERASWIPLPEDGPTRTSSRKQTIANKEITIAKLKEKDRRRDDTLAMMKAAEARKAKDEPKTLTQAERLAEAARVERVNSKSLHRWEEAEELRAAERQAKIDAFKNRQIEGPFVRYYSGPAIWVDDKLKYTGKEAPKIEDLDDKLNKDFRDSEGPDAQLGPPEQNTVFGPAFPNVNPGSADQTHHVLEPMQYGPVPQPKLTEQAPMSPSRPGSQPLPSRTSQSPEQTRPRSHGNPISGNTVIVPPQASESFLSGIEQYAAERPQPIPQDGPQHLPESEKAQPSQTLNDTPLANLPQQQPQQPARSGTPPTSSHPQDDSSLATTQPAQPDSIPRNPFTPQPHPSTTDPSLLQGDPQDPSALLQQFQQRPPAAPPAPPRRKLIRRALRNLLILASFPNLDSPALTTRARTTSSMAKDKDRSALVQLSTTLFGWSQSDASAFVTSMLNAPRTKKEREASAAKVKKELCAVTNQVARYRDPGTGIAYRDQKAFTVIKGVVSGGFVWSGALGCYVGGRARTSGGTMPAKGVPRRFLDPNAKAPALPVSSSTAGAAGESANGNGSGHADGSPGPLATGATGKESSDRGGTIKTEPNPVAS